jgi:hypothetical protein
MHDAGLGTSFQRHRKNVIGLLFCSLLPFIQLLTTTNKGKYHTPDRNAIITIQLQFFGLKLLFHQWLQQEIFFQMGLTTMAQCFQRKNHVYPGVYRWKKYIFIFFFYKVVYDPLTQTSFHIKYWTRSVSSRRHSGEVTADSFSLELKAVFVFFLCRLIFCLQYRTFWKCSYRVIRVHRTSFKLKFAED